jgi:hypothetical protein
VAATDVTCIDYRYQTNVPCAAGVYLLPNGVVLSVTSVAVAQDHSVQEMQRIAEEHARKQIAELVNITVSSASESSSQELRVQNNESISTTTKEQFLQCVRSDVKALLRGTRTVAHWVSDDHSEVTVAMVADPNTAAQANAVATSLPTALRADGGDQMVDVTGVAVMRGKNKPAARAAALEDACKRAVMMAVGVLIDADTITKNSASLDERIRSHCDGFVRKYDVLNETFTDSECTVVVRATVAVDSIRSTLQALGVMRAALGYPKMMCLFAEKLDDVAVPHSRLANVLENELGDEGVPFIDLQQLQRVMDTMEKSYMQKCLQDPVMAAEFGRTHGAEVIIVGEVAMTHIGKEPNGVFERVVAIATLKAINASSGKVLGSASQNEEGLETTVDGAALQACKRVAAVVKREMLPRVTRTWKDEANQGVTLKVVLEGVDQFRLVKAFKDALATVDNVVSVDQRAFSRDDKRVELDVLYKGKPSDFLDAAYDVVSAVPELAKVEPDQKDMYVRFVLQ